MADEKMISQVLVNLVKNAFQANAENKNGKVKIGAGLNENSHPFICVTDNGPGIPPEIIDQIFVPFFTTRESGSGIGLSIFTANHAFAWWQPESKIGSRKRNGVLLGILTVSSFYLARVFT